MPQEIIADTNVSMIILNWNGCNDTIECLESLGKSDYPNLNLVIVDNASSDNSVVEIKKWISTSAKFCLQETSETNKVSPIVRTEIIVNSENLGFAKANNIGISSAMKNKPDYIMLLNNDTVVKEDFLNELLMFFKNNPSYSVATPQIRYFDKPDIIWNCGGKLTNFGSRKYFFDDKNYSLLPQKDFLPVTFITGCAMIFKTEIIEKYGMLSEDFFFGEEDFEFSLRLKSKKIRIACVLRSLIFHKVNSSISKTSDFAIGKIYIHYLNRFINIRNFMPAWKWQLWRYLYVVYIFVMLKIKHKISMKTTRIFFRYLLKNSAILKGVDKATFEKYINFDFSIYKDGQ